MNLLLQTIKNIEPSCQDTALQAKTKLGQLTMPHWALGRILHLAVDLAAMTRSLLPPVQRKTIFIMAADHGITEEGVSLYPMEVTAQMVRNFVHGGAAINAIAKTVGANTVVVDVGVNADFNHLVETGLLVDGKVAKGTKNFLLSPAMSQQEAIQAINLGIKLALNYGSHVDLFGTGDMGIGNTTASAAIAAVLCQQPVESIVGRGTGLDDQKVLHKIKVIEKSLALHQPSSQDPLGLIQKVGGFEIAALTGLILGAASIQRPIVVDGYISTSAALLAQAFCPRSLDYMIPSHCSAEKGHSLMWEFLGKKPYLDLGMRLGEGTGSALAMPLLEASVRVMSEMATFESAGVSGKKHP